MEIANYVRPHRQRLSRSQPTNLRRQPDLLDRNASQRGRPQRDRQARLADQATQTVLTPQPFNSRTRVHEYGGGDYLAAGGVRLFLKFFRPAGLPPGRRPANREPITPAADVRYADYCLDETRNRLICVREDHRNPAAEAVNSIVSLDLEGNDECGRVLIEGNDFYSSPRVSPDGTHLAWLTWSHPNMPWDGCELWVGEFGEDGSLTSTRWVAGGAAESIFQPEWSPDGVLYFASDTNGWWNLHRISSDGEIESVHQAKGELGMPQWVFGMSCYAFISAEQIACSHIEQGVSTFGIIDTRHRQVSDSRLPVHGHSIRARARR